MKHFAALTIAICLMAVQSMAGQQMGEIHKAAAVGDLDKMKTLIKADSALLEAKDNIGFTPLSHACMAKQVTVANFLIDKGADVNAKGKNGFTPFLLACNGPDQDFDLVQHCIDHGADVKLQTPSGQSALQMSASFGNLKIVKLLIDHGADLNARDESLGTVLHKAINFHQEEVAKLLIENGAKINQNFGYGNMEIHLAALSGSAALIRPLVKHGADVNAVNEYHHTALYYASMHGYQATADSLIALGANKNDIVEANYGNAPQLSAPLKIGEAYLWYLGGMYGAGYAVKTKEHLIIFDEFCCSESNESGLAHGFLNSAELTGQKITTFITKNLDFSPWQFNLSKSVRANWVFAKPPVGDTAKKDIPPYHVVTPYKDFSVDGMKVYTIPAMGRGYGGAHGVGYLVEADGIKIFHAGFHASGNNASEIEKYRKEIDSLKRFGPIDIAMLPTQGHLTVAYEPYLYLLDQLSPKAVYLMGGDWAIHQYPVCADVLKSRGIPVKYPEGGKAVGERFHYLRSSK